VQSTLQIKNIRKFKSIRIFYEKMGGIMSKAGEWTEVVTGSSPGSPDTDDPQRISNNELAKRRILQADPRSVSDDVSRTPIQVDKTPNDSTPKATKAPAFWDPRSPSNELTRTPIILSHTRPPLNLDQDDDSNLDTAAPPPSRGAVADLKDIEAKVQTLQIKDDKKEEAEVYEKEEGEITRDCIAEDEKNDEHVPSVEKVETPVKLTPKSKFTLPEPKKTVEVKSEEYEKEDGEITHDSDEDEDTENDENLLVKNKTPVTIRSKSSLDSDCRSPLLIESSEPVFGKALTNELALMAAKNNTPRQRTPLGEVKNDSNDDSLLI